MRSTTTTTALLALWALGAGACSAADGAATPPAAAADEPQAAAAIVATSTCEDGLRDPVRTFDHLPTAQEAEAVDRRRAFLLAGARLEQTADRLRVHLDPGAEYPGGPPPDDDVVRLHLQSTTDPADTGIVELALRPDDVPAFTVRSGRDLDALADVAVLDEGVAHGADGGGRTWVELDLDDLPVAPPLRWFVMAQQAGHPDVADVCPAVTGFADDGLPVLGAGQQDVALAPRLTVTAVDHAFEGVPASVERGTRLVLRNASEVEAHEVVLLRLTEDSPPLEELLRLPPQEGVRVVETVGVAVALPGQQGWVTKGDLLLDRPGRYVLLCAIPVGADPAMVEQHPFGPPPGSPPPSAPPHLAEGMVAVVDVA